MRTPYASGVIVLFAILMGIVVSGYLVAPGDAPLMDPWEVRQVQRMEQATQRQKHALEHGSDEEIQNVRQEIETLTQEWRDHIRQR